MHSSDERGLRAALRPRLALVVVIIAFAGGLGLRGYHLATAPRPMQTADEYAWTWAGMSLLQHGVPASWSYLYAYSGGEEHRFLGQKLTIVSPWLDHPPLFSLLTGGWARLGGYSDPYAVGLAWMRVLPLLLWVAGFWLLACVLARLFDSATVAAALATYAVAPPMVLQSKLVVSENLLVPLFLAAYLLITRARERGSRFAWLGVGAIALALPLVKIPALALCLILALHAVALRDRRLVAFVIGGTICGLALYCAYGAHYGWDQFHRVQLAHAGRFVGFQSGLSLLFGTHVVDESVIWPLWYIGGIGLVVDAVNDRARDIGMQALVYAGCMTIFADQRSVYGWYWIPLYPMMAAGIGSFGVRMWRSDGGLYHALFAVIAVPWAFTMAMELDWDGRQRFRTVYILLMAAIVAVLALVRGPRRALATKIVAASFVALQLAADLLFIVRR